MKKITHAVFFLGYLLFLLALFCFGVEMLARHFRPDLVHLSSEREKFCKHDPEMGWVNKPWAAGRFTTEDFNIPVQINAAGRRDQSYDDSKPDNIFRAVVLGDSFTWGYGVEAEQIFSERLEQDLADTQVLNFGCSGYGQDQELLLLKREAVKYQPDLVIVNIHTHSDFDNNASFFQYGYYKPFFRAEGGDLVLENTPVPEKTAGTVFNARFAEKSVAWRILGNRKIRGLNLNAVWLAILDQKIELIKKVLNNPEPVDLTCRLCSEIGIYAAGRKSKSLFLLAPNLILADGKRGNTLPPEDAKYRQLKNCLQSHQLEFIDLRAVFEGAIQKDPALQITFTHDAHWNAYGHELVSQAVKKYLVSQYGLKLKTEEAGKN